MNIKIVSDNDFNDKNKENIEQIIADNNDDTKSSDSDEFTEEEYEDEVIINDVENGESKSESSEQKDDVTNNEIKLIPKIDSSKNDVDKPQKIIVKRKRVVRKKPEFGFIFTRCVKKPPHDLLWQECYDCIRKFYNNKIIIIDDNSNENLLTKNKKLVRTQIIKSEYPGAGELLPYYYFYKLHPFKKAIIMHDSMFIQSKIDFEKCPEKFLWYFRTHAADNIRNETLFISKLKNNENLLKYYKGRKWYGCFGSASIVKYDFVKILNDKYDFFILCNFVKNRGNRCSIERMIGLMMYYEKRFTGPISLFGEIFSFPMAFRLNYGMYKSGKIKNRAMIKVWNSR